MQEDILICIQQYLQEHSNLYLYKHVGNMLYITKLLDGHWDLDKVLAMMQVQIEIYDVDVPVCVRLFFWRLTISDSKFHTVLLSDPKCLENVHGLLKDQF